ncbi:DUF2971 domain-containing protein [Aeromonas popoffii]|uniref:DUF2971 domain-containing protein n=1 Tax=Aeromonas popoffii TaxID=70856 RepID=UPI0005A7D65D|nr:DUF2971 domain-containing protein [Aeromonas popoffii]
MRLKKYVRRYTELPFLIDYLTTKELVLLNPTLWDDRNDSYYIEQYVTRKSLHGFAALCLTEAPETYHHWKVFSSGSSGVCIEFLKEKLEDHASKCKQLRAESVEYCTIQQLRDDPLDEDELPFIKRYAFQDEKEFRLFWGSKTTSAKIYRLNVPLIAINRIILSPWLPMEVVEHVKATLKSIPGCKSLKIYKSSLVENDQWKSFAMKKDIKSKASVTG